MMERSCLNCQFRDPASTPQSTQIMCEWSTNAYLANAPRWTRAALAATLRRSVGVRLVSVREAENCPVFAQRGGEAPAGPLSEIVTKGE